MTIISDSSRTRAVNIDREIAIRPVQPDRPPLYNAAMRNLEEAVREACAMNYDLHALIGLQSLRSPVLAFARASADAEDAPEVMLRRLKGVLRPYERRHEREYAELVRLAIGSFYVASRDD